MTGDGATAGLLLDSLVAVIGLDAPTTWVGLFVGVLTGLLLLAYVAGRQLVENDSSESHRPNTASHGEQSGESTAAANPRRGPGNAASAIDDGHTRVEGTEADERQGGRARSTTRVGRDLDDGDRLVALLEDSGGQLRQSHIVAETDWSKTKVSRTLSRLAEEDEVVKIQLGRENLICLPGDVPSIGRERES